MEHFLRQLILILYLFFAFSPLESTHFRGAIIQWRPVDPDQFDGMIIITHRISWRGDFFPVSCDNNADNANRTLFDEGSSLSCRQGCNRTLGSLSFFCTDFSTSENWITGEMSTTYSIANTDTFEAAFSSCCWISTLVIGGDGSWDVVVKGDFRVRPDGKVNSSPVSATEPIIRLQHGCMHQINIPVQDVDQDTIRCRWASRGLGECGDICRALPDATLDMEQCTIFYNATDAIGLYAVAIQIEDFLTPNSTTPLSSVPLQFLVNVFDFVGSCSAEQPELVGETPEDGSCIPVEIGSTYTAGIVARVSGDSRIVEFITVSPRGLQQSEVTQSTFDPNFYFINITWTPSSEQLGQISIFCFSARNIEGLVSTRSCINLLGGISGPHILPNSITPTGMLSLSPLTVWSMTFDQAVQRPTRSRFINLHEERTDALVHRIDATSQEVIFPEPGSEGRSVSFSIADFNFLPGETYYLLMDQGAAVGDMFCNQESDPVTESSFWTFTAAATCEQNITEFVGVTYSWPESRVGVTASLPCPATPNSDVTRLCTLMGAWLLPNLSACNIVLEMIMEILQDGVSGEQQQVETISATLMLTVMDTALQSPALLETVSRYFEGLVESLTESGNNTIISLMAVESLVKNLDTLQQWQDSLIADTDDSSGIIMNFETIASVYAQQVADTIIIVRDGIIFVAHNESLQELQMNGLSVFFSRNAATLQPAVLGEFGLPEPVLLASVILPQNLFMTIENMSMAFLGTFFVLYTEPTLFPVRQSQVNSTFQPAVVSPVVAATVGEELEFSDLEPPIEINLRIDITGVIFVEGSERCVSWDFAAADGQGNWTTDGCITVASDDKVVTCQCTHLTNFAILVDICTRVSECERNPTVDRVLSAITYIGATISMISLVISIITLLAFKILRSRDSSKYHIQLCIAIFCMLLVFVSGVNQTANYGGCVMVSIFLHYFTLVGVMFMGAEAILMLQKLTSVFKKISRREIVTTSLICWGVPLLPVLISLTVDMSTGNDDLIISRDNFCFLSNPVVFWVAFLGPVLAIISFNVVIFIVVILILIKHLRGKLARNKESINIKTAVRLMVSITGVMFLFGLSWLFGALTITVPGVRIAFQVLFAIFTSLQGFFIFIFFSLFSREARESWKEVLSFGRYKSKFLNPNLKNYSNKMVKGRSLGISSKNISSSESSTLSRPNSHILNNNSKVEDSTIFANPTAVEADKLQTKLTSDGYKLVADEKVANENTPDGYNNPGYSSDNEDEVKLQGTVEQRDNIMIQEITIAFA